MLKKLSTELKSRVADELKDILFGGLVFKKPEKNQDIPKQLLRGQIPFGKTEGKSIYFPENDTKSKLLIGASGTGKTSWAKTYTVNRSRAICYIDNADGRAIDDLLMTLPDLDNVILLDHSDKLYPLPIGNFRQPKDIFESDSMTRQWLSFFESGFGIEEQYQTMTLISNACKAVFAVEGNTLYDVFRFVDNPAFRTYILGRLGREKYQEIVEYWNKFDSQSEGNQAQIAKSFLNRCGVVFRDTIIKCSLGYQNNLPYRQWMDEGKIVLIKCPNSLDILAIRIIISLHMLGFWRAALSRDDLPEDQRKNFAIITDEPQTWLSSNEQILDDYFSKARKYGLIIIPCVQSRKQIAGESTKLLQIIEDNEPDILEFVRNPQYHFNLATQGYEPILCKSLRPPKKIRDYPTEFVKEQKEKYNVHYQKILTDIERRSNLWRTDTLGRKSELQTNGCKTTSPHDSNKQKTTSKSSSSSMRIEL